MLTTPINSAPVAGRIGSKLDVVLDNPDAEELEAAAAKDLPNTTRALTQDEKTERVNKFRSEIEEDPNSYQPKLDWHAATDNKDDPEVFPPPTWAQRSSFESPASRLQAQPDVAMRRTTSTLSPVMARDLGMSSYTSPGRPLMSSHNSPSPLSKRPSAPVEKEADSESRVTDSSRIANRHEIEAMKDRVEACEAEMAKMTTENKRREDEFKKNMSSLTAFISEANSSISELKALALATQDGPISEGVQARIQAFPAELKPPVVTGVGSSAPKPKFSFLF